MCEAQYKYINLDVYPRILMFCPFLKTTDSNLGEIKWQFKPYTKKPLVPSDYDMSSGQESDYQDHVSSQTLAD